MLSFEALSSTVGLPLELGPSAIAPPAEFQVPTQTKLWHLLAWSDDQTSSAGIWHKGKIVSFSGPNLSSLEAVFVKPARGRGWVSLETREKSGATAVLLQSEHFNQDALTWLVDHRDSFERFFRTPFATRDGGADY
jgi:hypothetical protein